MARLTYDERKYLYLRVGKCAVSGPDRFNCERARGHEGNHAAHRGRNSPMDPGGEVSWAREDLDGRRKK